MKMTGNNTYQITFQMVSLYDQTSEKFVTRISNHLRDSLSIIYDGIPIYTRKLVRSEIKDEIGDDFLLSESIGFAEKYLTGDNIYNWARN